MEKKFTEIRFPIRTDQVIHSEDYKTLTSMDYFDSTIDKEKLKEFIQELPFLRSTYGNDCRFDLSNFLVYNEEVEGIRHCDTQEYSNRWRIQIQINIRIYPDAVNLLCYKKEKSWLVFYNNDLVVLTFSIDKK